MSNSNITVALLLGGTSPEKEVSKSSAKSIVKALYYLGYKVKLINPAYGLNQLRDEEKFFDKKEYTQISNRNYIEVRLRVSACTSSVRENLDHNMVNFAKTGLLIPLVYFGGFYDMVSRNGIPVLSDGLMFYSMGVQLDSVTVYAAPQARH